MIPLEEKDNLLVIYHLHKVTSRQLHCLQTERWAEPDAAVIEFSPEEIFWIVFAELVVFGHYDKDSHTDLRLSEVFNLYLTIWREDINPNMTIQEESNIYKKIQKKFCDIDQTHSDLDKAAINRFVLNLGNAVLGDDNAFFLKQILAATHIIYGSNVLAGGHSLFRFKLVNDLGIPWSLSD